MRCFDVARAINTINQICATSKFMDPQTNKSPVTEEYLQEGRKRLDVILPEFEKLGYQVKLQNFPYKENLTATNALITTKSNTSKTLLFTGHHDYCAALGAEDNATSLAIMLELGRCLAGEEINVAFGSFDLEEFGLQGSKCFVSNQSKEELQKAFAAVIALECLGSGKELVVCKEVAEAESDSELIASLIKAAERLNHKYVQESFNWFWSDHVPFAKQDIKVAELCSMDITEYHLARRNKSNMFDRNRIFNVAHTKHDIPQSIHPETINAAGETLLQFIHDRQKS